MGPAEDTGVTFSLVACEDFKKGETGYATTTGVWRLSPSEVPSGAFPVRAERDARAGKRGEFTEIDRIRLSRN